MTNLRRPGYAHSSDLEMLASAVAERFRATCDCRETTGKSYCKDDCLSWVPLRTRLPRASVGVTSALCAAARCLAESRPWSEVECLNGFLEHAGEPGFAHMASLVLPFMPHLDLSGMSDDAKAECFAEGSPRLKERLLLGTGIAPAPPRKR